MSESSEKDKKDLIKATIKCLTVASELEDSLNVLAESNLRDIIKAEVFDAQDFEQTLEWYQEMVSDAHTLLVNPPLLKDVDWVKEVDNYIESGSE